MQNQNRFYEFANFRIDVAKHRLLKDGEPLPVTPKAVEILLLLAQNSGRIVEKDELMAAIWPDTIVEESNLTQTVYVLRKVLGQDASGEKFIQTIPKRGYRFLHELRAVADESDLIVKHQTSSRTGSGEEVNHAEQARLPQGHRPKDRSLEPRIRIALQFLTLLSSTILVKPLYSYY